jgi:predicted transposase YbfD/YdcC
LGQVATDEKSNEIEAIPRLLELLDVRGALVSIDAMGCQKTIAAKIVAGGGDYILTVKDNQEHLRQDIEACFIQAYDNNCQGVRYERYETVEKGHGREEKRIYELIHGAEGLRGQEEWEKLSVLGKCYSERTVNGQTSDEMRYFIGSRRCGVETYGAALRNHWRMENCLHWQLDVTFGEDASRIQKRHGAENFALLRTCGSHSFSRDPKGSAFALRCASRLNEKTCTTLERALKLDLTYLDLLIVLFEDDRVAFRLFLRRAGESRHGHAHVRFAAQQVWIDAEIMNEDRVDARLRLGDLVAFGTIALRLVLR